MSQEYGEISLGVTWDESMGYNLSTQEWNVSSEEYRRCIQSARVGNDFAQKVSRDVEV